MALYDFKEAGHFRLLAFVAFRGSAGWDQTSGSPSCEGCLPGPSGASQTRAQIFRKKF